MRTELKSRCDGAGNGSRTEEFSGANLWQVSRIGRFYIVAAIYRVTMLAAVRVFIQRVRSKVRKLFSFMGMSLQEAVMEKIVIARTTDELKAGVDEALDSSVGLIIIRERRAKRAHRAVAGIRSLSPKKLALLAAAIARGDLILALEIIANSGLGPRRIRAIQALGVKRSYRLGTSYHETGYKDSDNHPDREYVLESTK